MRYETDQRAVEPHVRLFVGTPFGFPDLAFPEWTASIPAGGFAGTKIRPAPLVRDPALAVSGRALAQPKPRIAAVHHREDRSNSAS